MMKSDLAIMAAELCAAVSGANVSVHNTNRKTLAQIHPAQAKHCKSCKYADKYKTYDGFKRFRCKLGVPFVEPMKVACDKYIKRKK